MVQGLIHAWRHPKPQGAAGRCIGRTDLPLDRRKAKRLAHRIRQAARREGLPRVVCTSPLRRCALVGRVLKRWGWRHLIDQDLLEMDFGRWDGQPWGHIALAEIDAWCLDLAHVAPGGGEALQALLARARAWSPPVAQATVVAHAGWMLARQWVGTHAPHELPQQAAHWPMAPGYQTRWALP